MHKACLLLGGLNRPNSSQKLSSLLDDLSRAAPLVIIHALSSTSTDNDFPWRTAVPPEAFQVLALHILATECLLAGV